MRANFFKDPHKVRLIMSIGLFEGEVLGIENCLGFKRLANWDDGTQYVLIMKHNLKSPKF